MHVTITTTGTWQQFSATIPAPPVSAAFPDGSGYLVIGGFSTFSSTANLNTWEAVPRIGTTTTLATNFWQTTGRYLEVTGIQMETGNLVTPFENRFPVIESLLNNNIVLGSIANNTVGNVCAGNLGMFRNRVINGNMNIAQRGTGATTGSGGAAGTVYNCADRFGIYYNITTGGLTTSIQTLTSSDSPYQQGFRNSYRLTASTACTSYSWIYNNQSIEANNMIDFNWGTAVAVPVTLSFWLRSNIAAGLIVPVTIRTGGYSYNIAVAIVTQGSWQYVSTLIPALTLGTVASGNGVGLDIFVGSYNQGSMASAINTWQFGNFVGSQFANTSINIWATLNNYVEFTGLQLEKGTIATPFEFRPYQIEKQLCMRYYWQLGQQTSAVNNTNIPYSRLFNYSASLNTIYSTIPFLVEMRTNPTGTVYYDINTDATGGAASITTIQGSSYAAFFSIGGVNANNWADVNGFAISAEF
jgi:hypothetical protein